MKRCAGFGLVLLLCFCVGCQTTSASRGIHSIPVTRDYDNLEKADLKHAADALNQAERMGGAVFAPFEFFSAMRYLDLARLQAKEGDKQGRQDYAALTNEMVQACVRVCSSAGSEEAKAVSGTEADCKAEYDRVNAQYLALDKQRFQQNFPATYAYLTAAMSYAEHEVRHGKRWSEAAEALAVAGAGLDALKNNDADKDGVADADDLMPLQAEDRDKFEDEDGAPDPDNDKDGVPDVVDRLPNEAETVNGWHDEDGAPDELPKFDPVLFPRGSAVLSPEAKAYLQGLKFVLVEWPGVKLRLTGHALQLKTEAESFDVSRQRAEAVQQFLAGLGVPTGQMIVTFLGDTDKTASARVDLTLE